MKTERKLIVHLVHGTWPTGGFFRHKFSRWFKPLPVWSENGSEFCAALATSLPAVEFREFKWSGENAEKDRRVAALEFASRLRNELQQSEDCHLIIAHSHGGNVALWALGELTDTERARIAGLATLGTPFLTFLPRTLTANEQSYLHVIRGGCLAWLGIGIQIVLIPFVLFYPALAMTLLERLVPAAVLAGSIFPLIRSVRVQKYWAQWLDAHPPRCPAQLRSFLALRAPADEAARGIAAADLAARGVGRFWILVGWYARLTPWAAWGRQRQTLRKLCPKVLPLLVVLYGLLLWSVTWVPQEAYEELHRELGIASGGFTLLAIFWFVVLFGGFFSSVFVVWCYGIILANGVEAYVRILLSAGFGADAALLSIATEITAEAAPMSPPANMEMIQVSGDSQMRHSLHAMPLARERLAKWIQEQYDQTIAVAERPAPH